MKIFRIKYEKQKQINFQYLIKNYGKFIENSNAASIFYFFNLIFVFFSFNFKSKPNLNNNKIPR